MFPMRYVLNSYTVTCRCARDLLDGLWIGRIYRHLIHSTRNYRQLQQCRYSHTSQVTVTHTSVLSLLHSPLVVSWQRIHKSHCNVKSHMKSSLHSLISFLPLFSITFDCRFSQKKPLPLLLHVDSLLQRRVYRTVV
jgi:hypothetical protein